MFYDLVQTLLLQTQTQSQTSKTQLGGSAPGIDNISLFFGMLLVFLIKVLLVMISYNIIVPKLMEKYRQNPESFRPITFVESIFLVILFNNLFSRF